MNKKIIEKRFWKSYFRVTSPSLVPEKIYRLPWKEQNITNDDLTILAKRVKYVNQMDLDHTLVTNEGIEYLTKINIKELRLKNLMLDNKCIQFLTKISDLEFLHIGGTNISIEGIGRLSELATLKTLICTNSPIDFNALTAFKEKLPHCELIVNYKLFEV